MTAIEIFGLVTGIPLLIVYVALIVWFVRELLAWRRENRELRQASRAAQSMQPWQLTTEDVKRIEDAERDGTARPKITSVALPSGLCDQGFPEEFAQQMRTIYGAEYEQLLEQAGRALPEELNPRTEPLTDAEIDAAIEDDMMAFEQQPESQ